MNMTQINLRTLKAIALAASTEETRYYLNGVLIECRETRVTYVATNGHVLLCAYEDLPKQEPGAAPYMVGNWIVPNATIKAIKLSGKKAWAGDFAQLRPLSAKQFILGDSVFAPIDGSFPDWRRVLPGKVDGIGEYDKRTKTYDGMPAQFAPGYVALFGSFALAMGFGDKTLPDVQIHYAESGSPHAVTFPAAECFGVLMPRRSAGRTWTGAPDWTKEIYPNAQEEHAIAA